METKNPPSFTVSLRGYDREEVDEYLDSLAEALTRVEAAEEHSRRLQAHVARLNGRIRELEDRIRSETPRSGVALGERIGLLLREAEGAASETIARAEAEAERITTSAKARAAEAEELMCSARAKAEEEARHIEVAARNEATEIVSEAEARATARTRQIEQWAEQVVSHTRAEEVRMLCEQKAARSAAQAELDALAERRSDVIRVLSELRETLSAAVVSATPAQAPAQEPQPEPEPEAYGDPPTQASVTIEPDATTATPDEGPAESDDRMAERDNTGGHPAADMPEGEQFESKLEAWMAGEETSGHVRDSFPTFDQPYQ